jgi:TRAP-type C4-dicarboxylate transport system substrate-binding protein
MTPRMKSVIKCAICVMAAAVVSTLAHAQSKVSLSIAHIATLNVPNLAATVGTLKTALEATGQVDLTLYGQGSSYSDPTKFSDLVRRGVVDMAFGSPQFEAGRFPLNTLIGEPFIASDHIAATRAYRSVFLKEPSLQKEYGGVRVMVVFCSSPEQFHSVVPLHSIDDLKSVRVMTTNVGIMGIVQELGGSIVALPTSAQYEQLQKGVVGASSTSWTGVYVFGTNEVTKGHLEVNSVMTPNYLLINEDKYASLPPEVKKVIDDFSTEETAIRFAEAWSKTDKLAREGAIAKNATIVTLSDKERSELRARFQHLTDGRLRDLDAKGLPATAVFKELTDAIAAQRAAN